MVALVSEAQNQEARLHRSYHRWKKGYLQDGRKGSTRHIPRKLSQSERQRFYDTANSVEYRDYVVVDIFSRQIVGLSVEDAESSGYARDLFERVISKRGLGPQFVHSDNGNPMRGLTLVAFLSMLDVKLSFSRPRVSDDNPYYRILFWDSENSCEVSSTL